MIDETTDVSNVEQVTFCVRWLDSNLEAHEDFIGMTDVPNTQAATLYAAIQDLLLRMNFSKHKLRYAYSLANNPGVLHVHSMCMYVCTLS
jgi:hypothetical protein